MRTLTRITATVLTVAGLGAGLLCMAAPAHADPVPTPAPAPTAPATPPATTPPGTPAPTPGPTPTTPAPATTGDSTPEEDPAWYDVPGQIRKGVNDYLASMVAAGLNSVMEALGATVLATPDMTGNPRVLAVHTTFKMIANSLLVLFVIVAGYVLVTRETLQSRHGLRELLPRIFIAAFLVNFAMPLCGIAIEAANALAAGIIGQGVDGPAAATALQQALTGGVNIGGPPVGGPMFTLLVLAALVMAIVVVIVFFLRLAMLMLLLGVAPLALVCHALPQTEGLARMWWRAFIAVLGIQIAQAAILLATVRVFLTPDGPMVNGMPTSISGLIGVCMAIAMLWLMIKIPGWMKSFVLGPSQGRGLLGSIVRTVIAFKTLGVAAGALRAGTYASQRRGAGSNAPTAARTQPQAPVRSRYIPSGRPGPAAFSHAPAVHAPLPRPAGTTHVGFSSPQAPDTSPPGTRAGTTAAVFSHLQQPPVPMRPPARPPLSRPPVAGSPSAAVRLRGSAPQPPIPPLPAPAPVVSLRPRFSSPEPAAPKLRSPALPAVTPPRPAPAAATFSHPVISQPAGKRPPAPVTPVFSSPPPPPRKSSRSKKKDNPA